MRWATYARPPLPEAFDALASDDSVTVTYEFRPNVADAIITQHPHVSQWVIGGHSVGGTMAARHAGNGIQPGVSSRRTAQVGVNGKDRRCPDSENHTARSDYHCANIAVACGTDWQTIQVES